MSQDHVTPRGTCLLRIEAALPSLGKAERRIAEYVTAHPQDAVQCTIEQLQKKTGSGYATVIRFCKRLGYGGYKAFRNELIGDAVAGGDDALRAAGVPVGAGDSVGGTVDKIFDSSVALLQETRSIIDTKVVTSSVKALVGAGEVFFAGTGTSGLSARYAHIRFFRIGMRCSAETDSTTTRQKASILKKRDVFFAISSSGRSGSVVEAARSARKAGATVISLCDYAVSPLSKLSHINLYTTPRNVGHYLDKEMPLIVGQIGIIDVLFACVCASLERRGGIGAVYDTTKRAADAEKIEGR